MPFKKWLKTPFQFSIYLVYLNINRTSLSQNQSHEGKTCLVKNTRYIYRINTPIHITNIIEKNHILFLILFFFFLFILEDFQSFSSKYINNRYNIPIDLFHSLHEHGPIKRFFYFHNTCRQKKNSTHDVYLISTLQDFHNTESTLNNASVSSTQRFIVFYIKGQVTLRAQKITLSSVYSAVRVIFSLVFNEFVYLDFFLVRK